MSVTLLIVIMLEIVWGTVLLGFLLNPPLDALTIVLSSVFTIALIGIRFLWVQEKKKGYKNEET